MESGTYAKSPKVRSQPSSAGISSGMGCTRSPDIEQHDLAFEVGKARMLLPIVKMIAATPFAYQAG